MSTAFLAGVAAGYGIAVPVGAIAVLIAGLSARTSLRVGAAAGLGAATADGVYALVAVLGGAALAGLIAPFATPLRVAGAVILFGLAAYTAAGAIRHRKEDAPGAEDALDAAAGRESAWDVGDASAGVGVRDAGDTSRVVPAGAGAGDLGDARDAGDASGAVPAGAGTGAGEVGDARDVGNAPGVAPVTRVAGGAARPVTALRAYLGVLGLTLLNPATVVYFAALVLGRGDAGGGFWFVAGAFLASASWQLLVAGGGSLVGRLLTGERGRLITALISSTTIAVFAVLLL